MGQASLGKVLFFHQRNGFRFQLPVAKRHIKKAKQHKEGSMPKTAFISGMAFVFSYL